MFERLAKCFAKSRFFEQQSMLKNLVSNYAIPFYLRMIGGKIHTDDYVIFVDSRDRKGVMSFFHYLLDGNIDIQSYNEAYEVEVFSRLVESHPEAIIFDIGANYGMYTLAACSLRRQTDSMSIVAVEPDSRVFACLNKSLNYNKWQTLCRPVHAAAGECHNDYCSFVRHKNQSSFNFTLPLSSVQCPADYEITESVRLVTIDCLLKDLGIAPTNVIVKIDIEGNEIHAIEGMKKTLKSCSGYIIFCEYSVNRMNIAGNSPEKLLKQIFLLGEDGVYNIDYSRKSIVQLKGSVEFLREGHRFCNLLIVKNMDVSSVLF